MVTAMAALGQLPDPGLVPSDAPERIALPTPPGSVEAGLFDRAVRAVALIWQPEPATASGPTSGAEAPAARFEPLATVSPDASGSSAIDATLAALRCPRFSRRGGPRSANSPA